MTHLLYTKRKKTDLHCFSCEDVFTERKEERADFIALPLLDGPTWCILNLKTIFLRCRDKYTRLSSSRRWCLFSDPSWSPLGGSRWLSGSSLSWPWKSCCGPHASCFCLSIFCSVWTVWTLWHRSGSWMSVFCLSLSVTATSAGRRDRSTENISATHLGLSCDCGYSFSVCVCACVRVRRAAADGSCAHPGNHVDCTQGSLGSK